MCDTGLRQAEENGGPTELERANSREELGTGQLVFGVLSEQPVGGQLRCVIKKKKKRVFSSTTT